MFSYFSKVSFRIFFQDKYLLLPFVFSFILVLLLGLLLFIKMPRQTPGGLEILPLHYNVHFGIDYVGPWYHVLALPGGGLIMVGVNLILARLMYPQGVFLGRFLAFGTLLAQIMLACAAIFILLFHV